jgi:hypothetical protein
MSHPHWSLDRFTARSLARLNKAAFVLHLSHLYQVQLGPSFTSRYKFYLFYVCILIMQSAEVEFCFAHTLPLFLNWREFIDAGTSYHSDVECRVSFFRMLGCQKTNWQLLQLASVIHWVQAAINYFPKNGRTKLWIRCESLMLCITFSHIWAKLTAALDGITNLLWVFLIANNDVSLVQFPKRNSWHALQGRVAVIFLTMKPVIYSIENSWFHESITFSHKPDERPVDIQLPGCNLRWVTQVEVLHNLHTAIL